MSDRTDTAAEAEVLQNLYARTIFSLREARKHVLRTYAVQTEGALLECIREGDLPEHPAYEHYLSALIVEQTREMVRAQAVAQEQASVHLMLGELASEHFGARFSEPVRMAQDALLLSFDTGLLLEARYFSRDEYSIAWSWGDAELRIDTAPLHQECESFPNHLHDADGKVRADPVTCAGSDCWSNFSRLIERLLVDPLLERGSPQSD